MFSNLITQYWFELIYHEILFATLLFLIIWPLSYLLKNKSPHWKYYLWVLLFVRLILPTNFSLPGNVWQIIDEFELFNWINISSETINLSVFENELSVPEDQIIYQNNFPTKESQNSFSEIMLMKICFVIWLTGFLTILVLFNRKKRFFKNIIVDASLLKNYNIKSINQKWKKIHGINRIVSIYSSDRYLSPFTIGIIRPKIFLPRAIMDTGDLTLLNSIIGHEMAHIKRTDALWTQLQFLIQALFFFFPIVWFAGRQLNLAREGICDHMVLKNKQVLPKQYAQSVIQILQLNSIGSLGWPYAPALKGNKQSLKIRINQIMENKIMNKKRLLLLVISISLLGFVTLPMASILSEVNGESVKPVPIEDKSTGANFISPMKTGRIASGFGQRLHPITKVLTHHNGIDIAAPKGVEVYAIADGVVDFADSTSGYGNKIILIHKNNYSSFYAQLSKILVSKGSKVNAGQLIGLVGNSGRATAPHLHFEIRENNKPLDPQSFIDFSQLEFVK